MQHSAKIKANQTPAKGCTATCADQKPQQRHNPKEAQNGKAPAMHRPTLAAKAAVAVAVAVVVAVVIKEGRNKSMHGLVQVQVQVQVHVVGQPDHQWLPGEHRSTP